jgi:copper chaperone
VATIHHPHLDRSRRSKTAIRYQKAKYKRRDNMEQTVLKISGMTCQGCVNSVTRVLGELDGVESVNVTLEPGQATVTHDPAKASPDQLRVAIEGAGFDVIQ